jgi:hypothetical protein
MRAVRGRVQAHQDRLLPGIGALARVFGAAESAHFRPAAFIRSRSAITTVFPLVAASALVWPR